uniref:Uncharacterized protein n=1 Tax=Sphaerodactylus townsendi TaxID=933632 RepID=A0ACB8FH61_9SAUR
MPEQYGSFQTDKLECSQGGSWRSNSTANSATIQEQAFHSENSELLYTPSYSLPFSYHYGHFPVDPHVFSSKKQMLPSKFGQSQGTPCEVARFFLSTLQTSGECQWHYANSLVPSSQPCKSPPDQPASTVRHDLLQGYEVPLPNRRYSQESASDSFAGCANLISTSRYKEEVYDSNIIKHIPTVYEQTRRMCMKEPKFEHIAHHATNLAEFEAENGEVKDSSCSGSLVSTSPDNDLSDPDPVSLSKDLRLYSEQMLRMARALDIDVASSATRPKDKILSRQYSGFPGVIAFPILEGLSDLTLPSWLNQGSNRGD